VQINTVVERIFVLDGGTLEVESSTIVSGKDFGKRIIIPVQLFLLQTSLGYVLVDTGNDPGVITDPERTWGAELSRLVVPHMEPRNHPYEQLGLLGIQPSEIKFVLYTHLHHDHAGGARLFPDAIHVVQKTEYRWAFNPDRFASRIYLQSDFGAENLTWRLADGDWLVLPGIQLFATPGHTPGHQSIVLWDVPECGTVILAGDAVYCRENVINDVPPGIATDTIQAQRSIHRLTALTQAVDGSLLVSHDFEFSRQLPKAPKPLGLLDAKLRRFYEDGVRTIYGDELLSHALGDH
jgi:glyoxylase-like metal-dependent hydrolase (beta-lactamase superfamily II)